MGKKKTLTLFIEKLLRRQLPLTQDLALKIQWAHRTRSTAGLRNNIKRRGFLSKQRTPTCRSTWTWGPGSTAAPRRHNLRWEPERGINSKVSREEKLSKDKWEHISRAGMIVIILNGSKMAETIAIWLRTVDSITSGNGGLIFRMSHVTLDGGGRVIVLRQPPNQILLLGFSTLLITSWKRMAGSNNCHSRTPARVPESHPIYSLG